ncbi:MAG: SLBB domain-containing protein [Chloracidobacterium sp.]|nr:SLBB domain-containing protein [Chloracidobacterium sp.]
MRSRVNLKHLSRIIAVVGLGLTFASMATVSRAQLSPTPTPTPELVHYGDLIDLDVEGGFEFDWRGRLNPEGFLDGLNTYGDPVYGLCRSESDIAADVVKVYKRLLRDPVVIVRVIDRSNRAVATIDGAIKLPQRFQMRRPARLLELIVLAGGITDDAGGEIRLFRPPNLSCVGSKAPTGNAGVVEVITIADILSGKSAANPIVNSGDLITVLGTTPIYVIGGVNNPRNIGARTIMTVTRAIAAAGGLAKEADTQNIVIFRRDGGETRSIDVDIDKIAAGTSPDIELRPLDIVEVGQKGSGKRSYPPVLTGTQTKALLTLPLRIVE